MKELFPKERDVVTCYKHPQSDEMSCYVKQMRAPTRALGDLQLKHAEFNFHSNMPSLGYVEVIPKNNFSGPYINHLPDIMVHTLTDKDKYLILASDGLWDEINRKESAKILSQKINENNTSQKITK